MKILTLVVALLAAAVICLFAFVYSGLYSVAATERHSGLGRWLMTTIKRRSIGARVRGNHVPELNDRELIRAGTAAFRSSCIQCHGAPGREPVTFTPHMQPAPPRLCEVVGEWKPAELEWILQHGMALSGMPAFGPEHSRNEIRQLVAFLQVLPELTPQEFAMDSTPLPDSMRGE